jgi:hypothetical protein
VGTFAWREGGERRWVIFGFIFFTILAFILSKSGS